MTLEEAKQFVTEEVNKYQATYKKKVYLQKTDFYLFAGALCYCSSDLDKFAIMNDIREKLDKAEVREVKHAY